MPDGTAFAANAGATQVSSTQTDPNFSIEVLGRQAGIAIHAHHLLDVHGFSFNKKQKLDSKDPRWLQQRHVENASKALTSQLCALEDLIMASRAASLVDVTVQLMVAGTYLHRCGAEGDDENQRCFKILERALETAMRCVARHCGLRLADIGGAYYASAACDQWPEVDLSQVKTDAHGGAACAVDGSAP